MEACIALSIVFVAAEILRRREGLTARFPGIAFTFGLLHGFGFAGALSEVGLPQHAIPVALLFFNLGVEAGQLLFIGGVFAVAAGRYVIHREDLAVPNWAWRIPPYAIGTIADILGNRPHVPVSLAKQAMRQIHGLNRLAIRFSFHPPWLVSLPQAANVRLEAAISAPALAGAGGQRPSIATDPPTVAS